MHIDTFKGAILSKVCASALKRGPLKNADLGLHCPHMSVDSFMHGTFTHIYSHDFCKALKTIRRS